MGGVEQLPDTVAWLGELVGDWCVGQKDLGQAKGSKLIETFLNCEIEVSPKRRQSIDDTVGQHDDEGVAAGPRFQPDVDGPHLELHRLTLAKGPLDEGKILVTVMDQIFGSGSL